MSEAAAHVIVSDVHTNSTLGLCPPRVPLDDGGVYVASDAQRWLWRKWHEFWEWVDSHVDRVDADRLIVTFNGDVCDGDHPRTYQTVSRNKATAQRICLAALEPAYDRADTIFVVRGTTSHEGKGAWLAEWFADDIGAIPPTSGPARSHYHLRTEVEGVYFDIAHHGTLGYRPWTFANGANRLAAHIIQQYTNAGHRLPDVALRSHKHRAADSYDNFIVRGMFTPAWQLATEFVYRIAPEDADVADLGGYLFLCNDGRYHCEKFRFRPKEPEVIAA